MRYCKRCKKDKKDSEFGRCKRNKRNATVRNKWRAENKERLSQYRRTAHLKYSYNLTEQMYQKFNMNQCGLCAICSTQTKLFVDHCHTTGSIRGLLCSHCNSGLGYFKDSLYNLTSAYRYLFDKEPRSMINREIK